MIGELENKTFRELLKEHSVIGLAGSRSSAKTSLALTQLLQLKAEHPHLKVAVFGINQELNGYLNSKGITVLHSKMDILDLRMRDTVIFIDEMALFFSTASRNKELDKLMRFFDRIEHQNCKLICGTAREGYFNKFMCSRITAFMVKQIEYDALTNGTWLKERVKAIKSTSDYRLEMPKNEYYVVSADTITTKHTFPYVKDIDTKKTNRDLFDGEKGETKGENKMKQKVAKIVTTKPNFKKLEEKGFIKVAEQK
jgi:hypothetical protein